MAAVKSCIEFQVADGCFVADGRKRIVIHSIIEALTHTLTFTSRNDITHGLLLVFKEFE